MTRFLSPYATLFFLLLHTLAVADTPEFRTHSEDIKLREDTVTAKTTGESGGSSKGKRYGKYPCGQGQEMTIKERIEDCGQVPKKLSSGQTVTLVARTLDSKGLVSEYLRDDQFEVDGKSSPLIWGPEVSDALAETTLSDAIEYCQGLKTLSLKWHLPSRQEILQAGNTKNKLDHTGFGYNPLLPEVLNLGKTFTWDNLTSSIDAGKWYWTFNPAHGSFKTNIGRSLKAFRCVASTT